MNWNYFTFGIMGVIIALVVYLLFLFGDLPGKIARARNHPQADAINVCSWIGLVAGGVGWVVALVWAYTRPVSIAVTPKLDMRDLEKLGPDALRAEVSRLQGALSQLESQLEKVSAKETREGDAS